MSVRNALMACGDLPAVFSTPAIAQQTASTAPAAGTLCDADCIRSVPKRSLKCALVRSRPKRRSISNG